MLFCVLYRYNIFNRIKLMELLLKIEILCFEYLRKVKTIFLPRKTKENNQISNLSITPGWNLYKL